MRWPYLGAAAAAGVLLLATAGVEGKHLLRIAHVCAVSGLPPNSGEKPLPEWLSREIRARCHSLNPDDIEELSYGRKRAFEFTSGTRFDTGDEHALVSEDGKQICLFGGLVGHVT